MIGNSTIEHLCPACNYNNVLLGGALTVALTCTKCGQYFRIHTGYNDKFLNKFNPAIPVGSKGRIHNTLYQVMGFCVKREKKYRYVWREYFLFNPIHGIAFLSEYNGHWNLLKPYSKHPWLYSHKTDEPQIGHKKFRLYAKYRAELLYAQGEFFADVIETTESTHHYEHIYPPYILNFEEGNSRLGAYLGEYISAKLVATAFNIAREKMPVKEGLGYTQPILFGFDPSSLYKVTAAALLISFFILLFFNNTALNKKVLNQSFNQIDLNDQKMFTTQSFQLQGGTKNIEVRISAPISNDWFYAEYSLINEATQEEVVFTKELEYYSGYEGGEHWTEGSNVGEAFLSKIPEGRYHINIYPEFSLTNHEFTIDVYHDVLFYSNWIILFILLCLFPAVIMFYKYTKDVERWQDSDYSPYSE